MKRILKYVGWLVLILIVLGIGLAVAVRYYLTPERVRTLIEKEVSAQLHREVSVGTISVGIIKGLQVSDFKLSESPDFSQGTFISSEKFVLHLRLIPLMFKKILIKDIELVKPQVNVVRTVDGKNFNFSSLISSSSTPTPSAEGTASPLTFLVSRASIKNGTVSFVDQSPAHQTLSVSSLDLKLRNFSLTAPVDLQTYFVLKMKGTESKINFSGVIDYLGNLKIKTCSLTSDLSKITVSGETKNLLSQNPFVDLKLKLENLQTTLLAAFAPFPKELKMGGMMDGDLSCLGTKPDISLTADLNLDKTDIVYGNKLSKKTGTPMNLKLRGALKNSTDLAIDEVKLTLASLHLNGDGMIQNINDAHRSFKLRFTSNEFLLSDYIQHIPVAKLPTNLQLTGTMHLNAHVNGTANQGQLSLKLDTTPMDIVYSDSFHKLPNMPLTLETSAKYSGSFTMDFSALTLTMGRMSLSGSGKYLSTPKLDKYFFSFKSRPFPLEDVAAVLPSLYESGLAGKGTITNLKIVSTPADPEVNGSLTISEGTFRHQDIKLTQLMGNVTFSADSISIPKLTGLVDGSDLKATLNIKKLKTHPVVEADINVAVLDLDKLIPKETDPNNPQKKTDAGGLFLAVAWAALPEKTFMDLPMNLSGTLKATRVKHDYFTGQNLDIKWNLIDVTKDMTKINGTATLRQRSGEFKNVQKLTSGSAAARILLMPISLLQKADKATHGVLKLPSFDNIRFKEIVGDYFLKSGVLTISKFNINGTDLNASMTGTAGLGGNQPLNLKAVLTARGNTALNFTVTGTVSDPKMGLDVAATGKNVLDTLKNSGTADKLFRQWGLPGLGGSNQPPQNTDQNVAPVQPAEQQTAPQKNSKDEQIDEIKGLLKGIFNK